MDFDAIKKQIEEIKDNEELLYEEQGIIDKALLGVIKIEKKYLYGLEQTSTTNRRKELEAFLDEQFKTYMEEKDAAS